MAKACYLILSILALVVMPSLAQQPAQPVRLELDFNPNDALVEVLTIPDSSLLVYSKVGDTWGNKASFKLEKYNHKLEKIWEQPFDLAKEADYIRSFTELPNIYLVFAGKTVKDYIFASVNIKTGRVKLSEYQIEIIDEIYEYGVLKGKYFIIGRNSKDGKPLLLHLDPVQNKTRLLPAIYDDHSTFSDMLVDPANNRVDVVLTESNKRISRLQVKSFDVEGNLITNNFILQQSDKSLLNAEITPGDYNSKLLFGTYGTRDLRYSQGFFTADVTSGVVNGEFYNVFQLKNFFKYMKPRREERVRGREQARLQTGKEVSNRYRFLLHDLIPTPEGYILAAEVYYPQYRNNAGFGELAIRRSFNNRAVEGYKRSHAVVLGFDENGMLRWDNIIPLPNVLTAELVHTIELTYTPDKRVIVAYPENAKIIYSIIQDEQYDEEHKEIEILSYEEKDKILTTEQRGLLRWYGSNFVAYGFQRVKSEGVNSRNIFYINKISF